MISNIIVIIGFLSNINIIKARGFASNDGAHISDKNYHQLINFIKLLHSQNVEDQSDNQQVNKLESTEIIAQYQNSVDKKMNSKVKELMKLLQSNYNANKIYEKRTEDHNGAQPRIFLISNPEVLDDYRNNLKIKTETSSSSSSLEIDDMTRNLKEILQEMRRTIPPSDIDERLYGMKRENHGFRKTDNKDYSIEKAPWKLDVIKEVPKKNRDLSKVFDTDPKTWKKNSLGPKRPGGYKFESKYDDYKPKRDNYYKGRGDYRSYGRTSIPIIGKKVMYDKRK